MPFGNLSGPTLLVILFIVLLLFGAPKLPALARSIGQSMKILKKEVTTPEEGDKDAAADGSASTSTSPAAAAPAAPVGPPAPATPATPAAAPISSTDDELARAKAEAEAARAEAAALRAAADKRATESADKSAE